MCFKNKPNIIFLLCFLASNVVFAQKWDTTAFRLLSEVQANTSFITTDKLGQLYVVTPDNEFIKYSPEGVRLFWYNDKTLGTLQQVDVSDPMRPLLYYPEFARVVILDRTLNRIHLFDLLQLFLADVRVVAMASNDHFWVYDEIALRLKKIDRRGKVLLKSEDLGLLLRRKLRPLKMATFEDWVYLMDAELGLLLFDPFGQYIKTIPLEQCPARFQVKKGRLLYHSGKGMHVKALDAFEEKVLPLPAGWKSARDVQVQDKWWYVLKEKGVRVYIKE